MKKIQLIFIILLTISIVPPSNAKDLYKKNLNIKKNDTTLQGWKAWRVTGKKQLKKYEKKNKIKLFSVVNNPTRLGDTAFFIQAPGDECFQRKEDCERNSGTYKRVEAKQTDAGGILGEVWVTYSFNAPEGSQWQKYDPHILQFHSGVSEFPPLFLLGISSKYGLKLRVEPLKGLVNCDGTIDERQVDEDANYCARELNTYSLIPISRLKNNVWYDLLFNINFDSDPNIGFFKVWLNGDLIIDVKGQTLWKDKPVEEMEFNHANFNFGLYAEFIKNYSQSIYADEIRKARSCEDLKLNDLGYKCDDLINQNGGMLPIEIEDIVTGEFKNN